MLRVMCYSAGHRKVCCTGQVFHPLGFFLSLRKIELLETLTYNQYPFDHSCDLTLAAIIFNFNMLFLTLFLRGFVVSLGGTRVVPGTEVVSLSKAFDFSLTVSADYPVLLGGHDWMKLPLT